MTVEDNSQCLSKCEGIHAPGYTANENTKSGMKMGMKKQSDQYNKFIGIYDYTNFEGTFKNHLQLIKQCMFRI